MAASHKIVRRYIFAISALSTLFITVGCATSSPTEPTPYIKAASANNYGYSSMELSANEYRIMFKATQATPADKVQEFTLYRAAELAQKQGYDWVAIVKTDIERKTRTGKKVVRESNNSVPTVLRDEQCTMSGCNEVAQPFETSDADLRVEKTKTKDIYYSIVARMGNSQAAAGDQAFRTSEILSKHPSAGN